METEAFQAVLAAVRTFVRKEVVPAEDVIERTDEIPEAIRAKAADMGLFGYALPEEYGGLGFTMMEDVQLAMELGHTAPAFRSMLGTNNGIAGQVLVNFGTEEQKRRYLPGLAAGTKIASFALTESEAGSDPSGLRTRAVRVEGGYRITGQKRFITNADRADLFMVFARTNAGTEATGPGATGPETTGPEATGPETTGPETTGPETTGPETTGPEATGTGGTNGISVFVVESGAPGLRVGPADEKMGQRGAHTAEVFLDDVLVPESALVGGVEGEGFAAAMRSLARGRLHIAAICVGLAQRLVEESVAHAAASRQGGRPIAEFQQVQAMLADSQTELMAGRAMVLDAARAYDDGSDRRMAPSCAKLFCSEMVGRVADRAVQIHGGLGYMRSVPVERFYRDARLFRLYEGTSEVQKVIIAKQLLKRAHR